MTHDDTKRYWGYDHIIRAPAVNVTVETTDCVHCKSSRITLLGKVIEILRAGNDENITITLSCGSCGRTWEAAIRTL